MILLGTQFQLAQGCGLQAQLLQGLQQHVQHLARVFVPGLVPLSVLESVVCVVGLQTKQQITYGTEFFNIKL